MQSNMDIHNAIMAGSITLEQLFSEMQGRDGIIRCETAAQRWDVLAAMQASGRLIDSRDPKYNVNSPSYSGDEEYMHPGFSLGCVTCFRSYDNVVSSHHQLIAITYDEFFAVAHADDMLADFPVDESTAEDDLYALLFSVEGAKSL